MRDDRDFFFFNDTAATEIYTLSLHDALPICRGCGAWFGRTHGTPLYRLRTPPAEIGRALLIVMRRGRMQIGRGHVRSPAMPICPMASSGCKKTSRNTPTPLIPVFQ